MNPLRALRDYLESREEKAYGGDNFTLLSPEVRASSPSRIPFQGGYAGGSGQWGGSSWSDFFLGNTQNRKIDFAREVGDLRMSTLVQAAVTWVARGINSSRLKVVKQDADGKQTEIKDHPISKLWHRPNKYYSGATLNAGIAASWVIAATAYVLKVRGRSRGPVVELWYEPWWSIKPRWPQNGSEFISHYEVFRNGVWYPVPLEDVIMVPDMLDPDTRRGFNRTSALLSEFYTDKQASELAGLLLRNGLVPSIEIGMGDNTTPFQGDVKEAKANLMRMMALGEPFVHKGPATVNKLGHDMSSFGLDEMRQPPVQRFCAAMGISPISLMLAAGLDLAKYQNTEQYLRQDYRGYIIPLNNQIADTLEVSLLPDFGEEEGEIQIVHDYSEAPLMQSDKDKDWRLMFDGFKSRVFSRAQALDGVGMKFETEDEDTFYPVPSNNITLSPLDEMPEPAAPFGGDPNADPNQADEMPQDMAPGKKPKGKKPPVAPTKAQREPITDKDADAGANWWRTNAPPEARDLIDATIRPNGKAN